MSHGIEHINALRQMYLRFFEQKGHLIYPSASVKSEDPTLMFTSAGMVQFKPYFLGATPKFAGYPGVHHRVTTAQKCLRINDIENVGRTLRHHSFFEMLGNFSFGQYFKKEAAAWAWEFSTSPDWLGLDPGRLYVTIYQDDDEAYDVWAQHVGVDPSRISRWGEDENFWPANAVTAGPNGPCGPCSEIFYDRGPEFGSPDESGPNTGSGDRFIEYWNLVFTQFDRQDGGTLVPLPQKNIDTGLGFDRLAAVMTGSVDAYATELFQPTIRRVASLSGRPYLGPESVSHRVIADHVRALTFAITDGVMPANDGPGYVVKMLLRRASRHAWLLGIQEPVLHRLIDGVVEAMSEPYPELIAAAERVRGIVHTEEDHFLRTLEAGMQRVGQLLDGLPAGTGSQGEDDLTLDGATAFDLWQTYGFPLDLTEEMASERGIRVDRAGYEEARERARSQSRGDRTGRTLFEATDDPLGRLSERLPETTFVGYSEDEAAAHVVALLRDDEEVERLREGETGVALLDVTPFYAAGGGQVGDAGKLGWERGGAVVSDTIRSSQGFILHRLRVVRGELKPGAAVRAQVDPRRRETEKNHSATHLLHAALRSVLGPHVAQAGSLVTPERLRFDFSHGHAVTDRELDAIETLVNRWIQADMPVGWTVVPIEEARAAGAMMLFGEKYGHDVRMVEMGDGEALSIELCGGTHVRRTGQIGSFVVIGEEAVSAGVRRLEARTGMHAIEHLQELRATRHALAQRLGAQESELEERVTRLMSDLKDAQREAAKLRDRLAAAQTAGAAASGEIEESGGFRYATAELDGLDAAALRKAADALLGKTSAEIVVVGSGTLLVVKVTPAAQARGAHAGNLIREVARRGGGGGGGRADLAQAGIKDAASLPVALASVGEVLAA